MKNKNLNIVEFIKSIKTKNYHYHFLAQNEVCRYLIHVYVKYDVRTVKNLYISDTHEATNAKVINLSLNKNPTT